MIIRETNDSIYIYFIDYDKAFNRVYRDSIMVCPNNINMDLNDKCLF